MKISKYVFDPKSFRFLVPDRTRTWVLLRNVLLFIPMTMAVAVILYLLVSLVYNTPEQRRLKRENRVYEKTVPQLREKQDLLVDAIAGLQHKDADIYSLVFHSEAPSADPMASLSFLFASDSLYWGKLENYTRKKSDELLGRCAAVDSVFMKIFLNLADKSRVIPPMSLPVKNISYLQVGSGAGSRFNPFYKTYVNHPGLDFIVSRGTPVYAAADGVVEETFSNRASGKTVRIRHDGGYVTEYAHLDEIFVSKGQQVTVGRRIASSGMSGNSFAPHLHYAVYLDGKLREPVNHIFASVSPSDYANMLYMSVNTMQSMD